MTNPELPEQLPGFDEPLALLRACHGKIVEHCELIEDIVRALQGNSDELDTRQAARKAITYFTSSARQHHEDEEQNLFPLLIRQSLKLADLVNSLKQEHRKLDELWLAIEPELRRMPEPADTDAFISTASYWPTPASGRIQASTEIAVGLSSGLSATTIRSDDPSNSAAVSSGKKPATCWVTSY